MPIRSISLFIALLSHLLLLSLLAAPLRQLIPGQTAATTTLKIHLQKRGKPTAGVPVAAPVSPATPSPPDRDSGRNRPEAGGPAPRRPVTPVVQSPARPPAAHADPLPQPAQRQKHTRPTRISASPSRRSAPEIRRKPPAAPPPATGSASPPRQTADEPGVSRSVREPDRETGDAAESDRSEQAYRARVVRMLEANKRYPLRARRKGYQGTAVLEFVILPDGALQEEGIARPSGRAVLDRAALAILDRIQRFPPFPPSIERDRWHFLVPIRFALE